MVLTLFIVCSTLSECQTLSDYNPMFPVQLILKIYCSMCQWVNYMIFLCLCTKNELTYSNFGSNHFTLFCFILEFACQGKENSHVSKQLRSSNCCVGQHLTNSEINSFIPKCLAGGVSNKQYVHSCSHASPTCLL